MSDRSQIPYSRQYCSLVLVSFPTVTLLSQIPYYHKHFKPLREKQKYKTQHLNQLTMVNYTKLAEIPSADDNMKRFIIKNLPL